MSGSNFVYLQSGGQGFNDPTSWYDDATGYGVSTPGAADSVTIAGAPYYGSTVGGDATLASLTTSGSVTLTGNVVTGALDAQSGLSVTGTLTVTGADEIDGGLLVQNGSFTSQGALTMGVGAAIESVSNATISIASLVWEPWGIDQIGVQDTGSIEIGGGHTAAAGQLVVDAGQIVQMADPRYIYAASIINNGTIIQGDLHATSSIVNTGLLLGSGQRGVGIDAGGGTFLNSGTVLSDDITGTSFISAGSIVNTGAITANSYLDIRAGVSGVGQVNIGSGAVLKLDGSLGAGQTVAFTGEGGSLVIGADASTNSAAQVAGAVTGFDQSDMIVMNWGSVDAASWANGVLTLSSNGAAVEAISLQGNFAGSTWIVGNGTFATLVGSPGDTSSAPTGTAAGAAFLFNASGVANGAKLSWDTPADWTDPATGAVASVAPGAKDSVEFDETASTQIVTGSGAAASFVNNNDNLVLAGQYSFGSTTLNAGLQVDYGTVTTASLDGGGNVTVFAGAHFVDTGGGTYTGTLNADGGSIDVGLTASVTGFFGGLSVWDGGSLRVGGLSVNGFADTISISHTGSLEIGTGGHAVAGGIVIDSGAQASLISVMFPGAAYALELVNAGTITGSGFAMNIDDAITNSGVISNVSLSAATVGNSGVISNLSLVATTIGNTGVLSAVANDANGGYATLTLDGQVSGAGSVVIDSSALAGDVANVILDSGDIAAGQTIKFVGAGSSLTWNVGATIEAATQGFGIGDSLVALGQQITSATYSGTALSLFNGSTLVETLTIGAGYGAAHFAVAFDGNTSTITTDSNAVVAVGKTYTLTKKTDAFTGGAGNDTFVAAVGALNAKDVIDGGAGTNTLSLVGGGKFDLRVPQTLANIQTLSVVEGAGDAMQTITLRGGLNVTVNVGAAITVKKSGGDHLTRAHEMEGECDGAGGDDNDSRGRAGIRLIGGADSSVFNLGAGVDVVTLGSANETVNGGTGDALIHATAATAGAQITGGAGSTTLDVTGGGAVTLNAGDSAVDLVSLDKANTAYSFTANAQAGLTVEDDSTGLDTVRAGGAGQTLTGGAAGKLTMIGSAAGGDTFRNTAHLFNGDTIGGFSGPAASWTSPTCARTR